MVKVNHICENVENWRIELHRTLQSLIQKEDKSMLPFSDLESSKFNDHECALLALMRIYSPDAPWTRPDGWSPFRCRMIERRKADKAWSFSESDSLWPGYV